MSLLALEAPIVFRILACTEIADVFAFRQVSIASRGLVDKYLTVAFVMRRRLCPFFPTPANVTGFLAVLEDSASLVTGNFVLNLFGRQEHTNKKLSISVRADDAPKLVEFILQSNYQFVPRKWGCKTWLEELQEKNCWGDAPGPDDLVPVIGSLQFYNNGFCIQVDLSRCCPFDALIASESTIYLNGFDGQRAFCLYPYLSFCVKTNFVFNTEMEINGSLSRYYHEGWSIKTGLGEYQTLDEQVRFVRDSDTWVLDFENHGRQGDLKDDCLSANSWSLVLWAQHKVQIQCQPFGSSRMHSDYCVKSFDVAIEKYSAILENHHGDKDYNVLFAREMVKYYKRTRSAVNRPCDVASSSTIEFDSEWEGEIDEDIAWAESETDNDSDEEGWGHGSSAY
ncbi:hypothetical protein C8J56DRAFT_1040041 [Mycena floridula]|nr:hypothetical protein C8J56DRAFT_1040041 [Mycena floridula]